MKAQITLKSGAQLAVDIDDWSTKRSALDNHHITGFSWGTPIDWSARLFTLQVEEVVAVVILRDPTESARKIGTGDGDD